MMRGTQDWGDARRKLYEVCATLGYGAMLSYPGLEEILGVDPKRYRFIILRVAKDLERHAERTLLCVRNAGYRIAQPREHMDIGQQRHQRGRRQVARAVQVLKATPLAALSSEERRRHDAMLLLMSEHADVLRQVKQRMRVAYEDLDGLVEEKIQEALGRLRALQQEERPDSSGVYWSRNEPPRLRTAQHEEERDAEGLL